MKQNVVQFENLDQTDLFTSDVKPGAILRKVGDFTAEIIHRDNPIVGDVGLKFTISKGAMCTRVYMPQPE